MLQKLEDFAVKNGLQVELLQTNGVLRSQGEYVWNHNLIKVFYKKKIEGEAVLAHEIGHAVNGDKQVYSHLLLNYDKNKYRIFEREALASTWAIKTLALAKYRYIKFAIRYLAGGLNTYELDSPWGWKRPLGKRTSQAKKYWEKLARHAVSYGNETGNIIYRNWCPELDKPGNMW